MYHKVFINKKYFMLKIKFYVLNQIRIAVTICDYMCVEGLCHGTTWHVVFSCSYL